jgi:hypothetical protein
MQMMHSRMGGSRALAGPQQALPGPEDDLPDFPELDAGLQQGFGAAPSTAPVELPPMGLLSARQQATLGAAAGSRYTHDWRQQGAQAAAPPLSGVQQNPWQARALAASHGQQQAQQLQSFVAQSQFQAQQDQLPLQQQQQRALGQPGMMQPAGAAAAWQRGTLQQSGHLDEFGVSLEPSISGDHAS